jgi:hypothetical protein
MMIRRTIIDPNPTCVKDELVQAFSTAFSSLLIGSFPTLEFEFLNLSNMTQKISF